jgi:large repetitive protein
MKKLMSLTTAIIFMTVVVFPVPVKANAYILLSSYSGQAGSSVSVSGQGFQSSELVSIYVGESQTPATTLSASAQGSLGPVSIAIPMTAAFESMIMILAQGQSSHASVQYYVQAYYPSISVSSTGSVPFSTVFVEGSGFAPNESISISMGSFINVSASSGQNGAFSSVDFTIPKVEAGSYTINAIGAVSKGVAVSHFYVDGFYPNIFPSAYYLMPGQTLRLSGGGFAPNETVSVLVDSLEVAQFKADSNGAYKDAGAYTIPVGSKSGKFTIVLKGNLSNAQVQAEIFIGEFNPQVFPSSYYVLPGDILSFSGIDFAPNETLKVYDSKDSSSLNSVITNANGEFPPNSLGFKIPAHFASTVRTIKIVGDKSDHPLLLTVAVGKFSPQLQPSSYYIKSGEEITVDGWNFLAAEQVVVNVLGKLFDTLKSTVTGNIKFGPLMVPFDITELNISAHGEESGGNADLNIPVSEYFPTVGAGSYYLKPGEKVWFSGGAFAPNEKVLVSVTIPQTATGNIGSINTNKDGYLLGNEFQLGYDVPAGPITFSFQGEKSKASSQLEVEVAKLTPQISLGNYYPAPGSNVRIWVSGFAPAEKLNIHVADKEPLFVYADEVGSAGPVTVKMPLKGKSALIEVAGGLSGASLEVELDLMAFSPVVSPSAYHIFPGKVISFNGWDFAPNEEISVSLGSAVIGAITSDSAGNFESGTYQIPFSAKESVAYTFTGEISENPYTVTISLGEYEPYILLGEYYGVGGSIAVSGFDFAPNENVKVLFGNVEASAFANSQGRFALTATVPKGAGNITVIATGQSSGSSGQAIYMFAE